MRKTKSYNQLKHCLSVLFLTQKRTEHLKGHWKVRRACNEQDNTSHPIQFRGVLTSMSGRAVSWIMEEGSDPSGLGRWSWQRLGLRGHGSTILISAYVPCDNPGEGFTVWDQHKRAFGGSSENPRTEIPKDLQQFMTDSHHQGYKVVPGIDANVDIKSNCFRNFPSKCGLKNTLFARHKRNGP